MVDNAPVESSRDDDLVTLPDGRVAQLWQGGAATGPVVFFLHGCPDTRRAAFSGDGAARRAGVRLVAVNRPGYGRSEPCASGHASVADDTLAVAGLARHRPASPCSACPSAGRTHSPARRGTRTG